MGYKFQNFSFLGFQAMYLGLFQIAKGYREEGVTAFARLQQTQIKTLDNGYRGWKLQSSVGTGYFDDVARTVAGDALSTAASRGSTEESQF